MSDEAVTLTLGADEALVLFEWLHRVGDADGDWVDQAEQRAVWDLTASLERELPVLAEDYAERLAAARQSVRDPEA